VRRAALLAAFALALVPAPALAGILAPEDATEAAQSLADAQSEQDVCYGWSIDNDFGSPPDVGSSTGGPNVPLNLGECRRYVVLVGDIHYACGSCEDSDSAGVAIDTNLTPPPTEKDLENLGLDAGELTGDNDDVTLLNMIGALPLLASQTGAVPALPAETPASVPAGDVPTNGPGSDFMREAGLKLVLFVVLLLGGPLLWRYKRKQEAGTRRTPRSRPSTPTPEET
jgi:hypothetical protein